jgi:CheY-like chemotaxis protein
MRQLVDNFQIKGIALSGYGMDEDIARSKQAGFTEHITKPVDISRFEQIVRKVAIAADS